MSNPYGYQPSSQSDPWHGQAPLAAQLPENAPPQSFWPPSPPVAKQRNGLAIAALVVACLALLVGLGLIVSQVALERNFNEFSSAVGGLEGSAPQVVVGRPYPGKLLQAEVGRLIRGEGGDVSSMTCPETPQVKAGTVTICHGMVDGFDSSDTVTFEDGLGHFTLTEG